MALTVEQQLAASRHSLAKTKAALASKDSALSDAHLRVTDLTEDVATLSHRVDSLTAITEAKPVKVHVTRPLDVNDSIWDILGVTLVPLLIVALTAWTSRIAAIQGAREGAKATLDASKAAIREEVRLEREHAIEQLHKRVKSNLRRVTALAKRVEGHKATTALDPDVGEELEVIWNLYYRVMEPIFTIKSGDLAERLDAFFVRNHTLAEMVKGLEARSLDVTTVGHETEKDRDTSRAREALPKQRQQLIEKIAALGNEAEELLTEVLRIWPEA